MVEKTNGRAENLTAEGLPGTHALPQYPKIKTALYGLPKRNFFLESKA